MADIFTLGNYGNPPHSGSGDSGSSPSTGDLRRKYNFGDRVSELAIAQDPFFRFVSKVAKSPVDDPEFKFTERRGSWHKRYAYVENSDAGSTGSGDNGTIPADSLAANSIYYFKMGTDYKYKGNVSNVLGSSNGKQIGAADTLPQFFVVDSIVKIPLNTSSLAATSTSSDTVVSGTTDDYALIKVEGIETSGNYQIIKGRVVKAPADSTIAHYCASYCNTYRSGSAASRKPSELTVAELNSMKIATELEQMRSYVVGTAHGQGTGYPETWKDQPFSTAYGLTQIWKTAMAMDNTTRATVLKYDANEFARIWREKLIEHKWDIEQSLLFGSQGTVDGVQYTQGAVDYCLSFGNIFSGTGMGGTGAKSQDDFLDDMSQFLDPRYNNANATLFMVPTDVYNWLHKLSGYFSANVSKVADSSNVYGRGNFDMGAKKNVFGVDITQIFTPYGVMNVARNIHLDGTQIKMLAVNMKHCKYRPLVGNGLNRDTAVYVGVQTLENSGVDRRVDLIQTEAGMEWQMPEAHAVWK